MKWLKTGVFCATMALAGGALAQTGNQQDWQSDEGSHLNERAQPDKTRADRDSSVEVRGVVTEIDKKENTLTVVTPLPSASITEIGDAYVVDEGTRLVAIRGQWKKSSQIVRDGKTAKLQDLKEGDVVRTSYDAQTDTFGDLNAMSKKEIKKEISRELDRATREGKKLNREEKQ